MSNKNDIRELVVIGAGPGGYAAAFHAADLGVKVTLVDKAEYPGGVCLYRGCIPTKAMLHVAKVITDIKKAEKWGIEVGEPKIDLKKLRVWKESVIRKLTQGLGQLCKKRKIEYIQAEAAFTDNNTVEVKKKRNNTETISFEHAILATGAAPATIPDISYELHTVMDSTAALELNDIPESMLVIGGGYIGLELGSIYASLGTKVSITEIMPTLMPGSDQELISILAKRLGDVFESIMLDTKIAGLKESKSGLKAVFEGQNVKEKEKVYEKVIIAVGRKPNSANIGLENTKVEIDDKGFVRIKDTCQTTNPSIYAVGDITGPPLLAHKATHQAIIAAKVVAGYDITFEPKAIPSVEYTEPEIAECGLSEEKARNAGLDIKVARFPWYASGRAATLGENDGLTKLVVDADTERILGAGIVGTEAGELISEVALAIEMAAVASDLALTIHPHPTLSETLMEASEEVLGKSINL